MCTRTVPIVCTVSSVFESGITTLQTVIIITFASLLDGSGLGWCGHSRSTSACPVAGSSCAANKLRAASCTLRSKLPSLIHVSLPPLSCRAADCLYTYNTEDRIRDLTRNNVGNAIHVNSAPNEKPEEALLVSIVRLFPLHTSNLYRSIHYLGPTPDEPTERRLYLAADIRLQPIISVQPGTR